MPARRNGVEAGLNACPPKQGGGGIEYLPAETGWRLE
jgi:hypothetical protein